MNVWAVHVVRIIFSYRKYVCSERKFFHAQSCVLSIIFIANAPVVPEKTELVNPFIVEWRGQILEQVSLCFNHPFYPDRFVVNLFYPLLCYTLCEQRHGECKKFFARWWPSCVLPRLSSKDDLSFKFSFQRLIFGTYSSYELVFTIPNRELGSKRYE